MLYLWIALMVWLLPAAIVGCAILKIAIEARIESRRSAGGRHRMPHGRHRQR